MKHPIAIEGIDISNEQLIVAIGKLRYDKLAEFVVALSRNIEQQAMGDMDAGRLKLSDALFEATRTLKSSAGYIADAWKICKPFMKDE